MMNKCREKFEKEAVRRSMSVVSLGFDGYPYQAGNTEIAWQFWQAAWNARQPEANMLDLGGLERFGLVEDSTWYNCLQAKEDGDYVRYSDLTNALLTKGRGGV